MTLTTSEIDGLLGTLDVARGAVQKVYEADPFTLVFQVRVPGETVLVLWSALPGAGRLHRATKKPQQPQTPTGLTMGARKYLTGRSDLNPVRDPNDRVVRWNIGDHTFVGEFTNHPALMILDSEGVVLAHSPNAPDRVRAGVLYEPAPPMGEAISEDRFLGNHEQVALFYAEHVERELFEQGKRALKKEVSSYLKKLRRLATNLEGEVEKCLEAEGFQKWGTLLQQAHNNYQRGAKTVTVTDYYDPEMGTVEVPLDPKKNLENNIERYFHQYKRLTAAFDRVSKRLAETEKKRTEVETLRNKVNDATELTQLEVFSKELLRLGFKPKQAQRSKRKGEAEVRLPYHEFFSRSGKRIWVGRGAKHNDALTTKFTRGKDVWLHAKDWAGAHVALKATLNEATSEDLIDAALLAAHFSKGTTDTVVEVTYTEGKHVRKPKGAAPGLVTVSGGKTLAVRFDDERLSLLLNRKTPPDD